MAFLPATLNGIGIGFASAGGVAKLVFLRLADEFDKRFPPEETPTPTPTPNPTMSN